MRKIQPLVWYGFGGAVLSALVVGHLLQVPWGDLAELQGAGPKIGEYFPPSFPEFSELATQLTVTVVMGAWGTLLALAIALPLSFFAARNVTPSRALYGPARLVLNFVRSMPDPILVLLLISCLPIGPLPGVLALGIHSAGFLGKAAAESMERTPPGLAEGLAAVGATRLQVARFGVYPSIVPELTAYTAYTLYRNILMAVTLGIVGAGGIGAPLNTALRHFEKERAAAYIAVIAAVVVAFDAVAMHLRERSR